MATSLSNMKLETLGEITALGVMADIFKNVATQAMGTASSFTSLSSEFDINTQLLQRWQNVAVKSNVPIEAVANSFTNVQKILTGFKQGQINTGFLQGASFLKIQDANQLTYDQLFQVLRTRVPEMIRTRGRAETSNALAMMGIDPAMIQMLALSSRQFQAREAGPIMSKAQIQNWVELNEQIITLKRNLQLIGQEIGGPIIKALNSFIGKVQPVVERIGEKGLNEKEKTVLGIGAAGVALTLPQIFLPGMLIARLGEYLMNLGDKGSHIPGIVQNNNFNTSIEAHGPVAEATANEYKRHMENKQFELTSSIQIANGQVAR